MRIGLFRRKAWTLPVSVLALAAVACGSDAESPPAAGDQVLPGAVAQLDRKTISLGISMYLLVDAAAAPGQAVSTSRSEDDLREILAGMNEIWSQADIRLTLENIGMVEVPLPLLRRVASRDFDPFFSSIGGAVVLPGASDLNAFFTRNLSGANGVTPLASHSFFVIDDPSVHDRRVSSHEVGHILGLHHVLGDSGRLLFSGTNGMTLTTEEQEVARYAAQGIIDRVR